MKDIKLSYKKRLVFIIEYSSMSGGMLHSVFLLIKEIKDKYDIVVICPKGEFQEALLKIEVRVSTLRNKTWGIRNPVNTLFLLYQLRVRLNSLKTQDCIVITNNIFSQFLVSISHYKKHFNYVYFNRGGHFRNRIGTLVAALSKKNDVVICTSNFQKEIVECSGILRYGAKAEVLYNPIEVVYALNYNNSSNAISSSSANNGVFVIGIVGYVDAGKNQILAIQALNEINKMGIPTNLEIYGQCNDLEYLDMVRAEIYKFGLEEKVSFQGYIIDKSVIYSRIDLLLSTSLSEGFGRTLAEAMAYKKPVIALKCSGGPKDIIKSDDYGLLVDETPVDIAHAIKKFATDKDYTVNTINMAHDFVVKEFSPKEIGLKFIKILEESF